MSEKKGRRKFINKLAAIGAGTVIAPALAYTNSETKKTTWKIKNIAPMGFQWNTLDPFLFCVHHEDNFPKGNNHMGPQDDLTGRNIGSDFVIKDGYRMYHGKNVPGFPGHPHRGFETVTVVRDGIVDHSDSLGASGRYGNGDVQWMTAGKGVNHAEMFPLLNQNENNSLELFQIWLNLPAKKKMVNPDYKMLWDEKIPKHLHTDQNNHITSVEVIAGNIKNDTAPLPPENSWARDVKNEVAIWNIMMDANAEFQIPKGSPNLNRTIYIYDSEKVSVDGQEIKNYHSVQLNSAENITIKNIGKQSKILLLQGKPINEPVVQHGPFVMNTKEEIKQTFEDYQKTQFGGWPWKTYEQVHDRNIKRFARFADGSKENPST